MMAPPPPSVVIDARAISGITGSISIACWIIVFAPQIYENFIRKSAQGLSMTFVVLWLLGDIFNVIGAVMQGVLPTMIILAIYYTLADIVLLAQCLVYSKGLSALKASQGVDPIHLSPATPLNEHDNLLESVLSSDRDYFGSNDDMDTDTTGLGSDADLESFLDTDGISGNVSKMSSIYYNTLMVFLVVLAGVLGWWISDSRNDDTGDDPELVFDTVAQIFGWLCAFLYLGSRVPQILLNYERKSCDGISFLFFLFACLGNLTYVVSILSIDTSYNYLLVNSSWLAGSLGTLFLDFTIFVQFFIYNESKDECSSSDDEYDNELYDSGN
ncbi:Putative vacuolar membrane transporter for cationic amino acids [Komagataella phaffii CBS 7435]|uniref:Uncharacterized protein n=2 Tax=Komagataella phaffii TaxID=460519 RepID=C4QWH7_KOMPG|nr:uncharacterized protein PAS_chr1-1_0231 [Komagataella phaffii GS115]AOA60483.1 GQ67_02813T0 [Komagataella phaffii]CAH2446281.1 Putative vacuolar membrane transporter for cationic amino acids [Komagataella phaffii CBS 7435]AOA65691.1 GQ68_02435T0 [Komagataella phaffii GS115]CAY67600.1 Putative protein of unknown function [Komagataella phaffii GS115]CCA36694.1 Putative vacuolar membrane transporter for cationic amino acids [Komagataella phaffii CBS 7435]